MRDWTPENYDRFGNVRLQPALDLLGRIGEVPEGDIVDLGCGSGAMGEALVRRFPGQRLIGVDASPAMLGKALSRAEFSDLQQADIADWVPERAPGLIFSNAALQWLGGHEALLPRLARSLRPGGYLAVQMPHQNAAPSHRGWAQAFAALFGDRAVGKGSEVLEPGAYFEILTPYGDMQVWESEYYQHLPRAEDGHPVRLFTESTFGRPYLAAAGDTTEQARLIESYEAAMAEAYPLREDGSVLFPFRRLFFVLRRASA